MSETTPSEEEKQKYHQQRETSDTTHAESTTTTAETTTEITTTNENTVLIKMDEVIEESQCIGSIGSRFSTDQLVVNLNNEGSKLNLKGKMLLFQLDQDGKPTYVISQISSILGKNPA